MNEPTTFNALCDLWTSHFNIMLTCVTILAGLFGLGCPLMFSMFQRQNLKDERERMNKEMADKFAEVQKQQQELISQQNSRLDKLQELTSNAYVALANYYLDELMRIKVVWNDPTRQEEQKERDLRQTLIYFGNALQCLVNSRDREELVKIMATFCEPMSAIITRDKALLAKALDELLKDYPSHNFFVFSDALAEIAGPANSVYIRFVSGLQPLFEFVDSHYSGGDEKKETTPPDSAAGAGNNTTQP